MNDKLPPCDIEAEKELLTAVLIDNEIYYTFADILNYDDFYKTAHQFIYSAMENLFTASKPVDFVTLASKLKANETLEAAGGAAYILTLLNRVPLAINALSYVEIIKKLSTLRKLTVLGNRIVTKSMEYGTEPGNIITEIDNKIRIISGDNTNRYAAMKKIVERTTTTIEKHGLIGNAKEPIFTGLKKLDDIIAGFTGGKLVFIAARPGIGKTSLMLTMARNMAKKNVKVGIMSIEMEEYELDTCWLAMESGINSMRLRAPGILTAEEWNKITEANGRRYEWPITVDDSGGATIASVRRTAQKMVHDGCEIIFIDQLSKIKGTKLRTKFDETTEVVESLGTLKKELRIPIVVLAQINRQGTESPMPTLTNLKNTGQIEEEADIVLILHREEAFKPLPSNKGIATITVAKQRGGATGCLQLGWDAKRTHFFNIERTYTEY